jgi:predicted unusual protein kinase regulating ubiquinone biosynthesis (AarF/ABC1/UbiB family)
MYDIVEEFIGKVKDSTRKELLKIRINIFNENYGEALKLIKSLLIKDKDNIQFTIIKANICYLYELLFEAE